MLTKNPALQLGGGSSLFWAHGRVPNPQGLFIKGTGGTGPSDEIMRWENLSVKIFIVSNSDYYITRA